MNMPVGMMQNHWWWRPGWCPGRSFYTWHITFLGDGQICEFSSRHESIIDMFETLDRVPVDGLHVTLQGIGFTDEVDRADIDRIIDATQAHCSRLRPFSVEIGPAYVDMETVQAPVHPIGTLARIRHVLRRGIGEVLGERNVPENAEGFRPHLTLAYSNGAGSLREIEAALRDSDPGTIRSAVSTVSLIDLNRDRQRYEWSEVAKVQLG